ncbi:hypothetical protein T11_10298 [Trichinella zimbabwensis]|uniref:Uncharacterized protein n=1 Tax=Trichinella zimbabwensis TaxID=268475 RepID=A0A0V1I3C3_9BILA|nr:hypothetical protein T11_10298 [Trichinella zimbabwensis]
MSFIFAFEFGISRLGRSRGCRGTLSTNLEATEESDLHKYTCGELQRKTHAFYILQKREELKRLAGKDPRPVQQICDELTSSASTSLETAGHFTVCGQVNNMMCHSRARRYPGNCRRHVRIIRVLLCLLYLFYRSNLSSISPLP